MSRTHRTKKERCAECKNGFMQYSKVCGGFVVGCNSDGSEIEREFGKSCFVQKLKQNSTKTQNEDGVTDNG